MRYYILSFIILFPMVLGIYSCSKKNETASNNTTPQIKSLVTETYDYSGDSLVKPKYDDYRLEQKFNEKGKLIFERSERYWDKDPYYEIRKYNENGTLLDESRFFQPDRCFERKEYILDEEDRIVIKRFYVYDSLQKTENYHYQKMPAEQGLTKEIMLDTNERVLEIRWYNEKANLVKRAQGDEGTTRDVWEFNNSGQITARYVEGPGKRMLATIIDHCIEYDEKGRIILERSCEENWESYRYYKYEYSKDGSYTKTEISYAMAKQNARKCYFDAKGNMTKDETYRNGVELSYTVDYAYEFDRYGNWILQTEIHGKEKKRRVKRTIHYF